MLLRKNLNTNEYFIYNFKIFIMDKMLQEFRSSLPNQAQRKQNNLNNNQQNIYRKKEKTHCFVGKENMF